MIDRTHIIDKGYVDKNSENYLKLSSLGFEHLDVEPSSIGAQS